MSTPNRPSRVPRADRRAAPPTRATPIDPAPRVDTSLRAPSADEQRQRALASRAAEVRESHWHVRICLNNHVIETHRATDDDAASWRCPICGNPTTRESPEATAHREHTALQAPLAVLARAYDAVMEWSQQHLDARAWTQRSEMIRERAMKAARNAPKPPDPTFGNQR